MSTNLPAAIRAFVDDADGEPIGHGKSGAAVRRYEGRSKTLYLKTQAVTDAGSLRDEADRLHWLNGRVPVPNLVAFAQEDDCEYLLLTGLPGVNGVDASLERPADVVAGLADALKSLHQLPAAGCPFEQTVPVQVERARQRVRANLVDEDDFDEERLGRAARDVLVELEAWRPDDETRALTHGDPCLPNVLFSEGSFTGFVDCGRFGVADPYQDLALAARSIGSNLGSDWVYVFFDRYGLAAPDRRKLSFYRLLDEFF